jgi:hypothetical protein
MIRVRSFVILSAPSIVLVAFFSAQAPAHDRLDFVRDVQPILVASCGGSGCHINEETSGVELTSYATLMASVGAQYGGEIVIAGDPEASPLIDKVTGDPPAFGERMPYGGDPLSDAQVMTLRRWIAEGAAESHLPLRGDLDGDDERTVTDALRILDVLFRGGEPPACAALADTNTDLALDVSDAVFLLLWLFAGGADPGSLSDTEAEACEAAGELSFANIHEIVFARSCAFASCHSAESRKADLSLATLEEAYSGLVGAVPYNDVAREAGLLRVDPGLPENSFLLRKLTAPGEGEGNRMPANSPTPLSESTVGAIREWILAGAPREGTIDGVPAITEEPPPPVERMPPPPPPEFGVQLHLPAFTIGPRDEREIFYFIDHPFAALEGDTFDVRRIDIHMMEQSHHFILYKWLGTTRPPAGVRDLGGASANHDGLHQWITESQQSFRSVSFPQGVGIRFSRNDSFDVNSHYVNLNGEQPLLGEVYVNLFFAEPGEVTALVRSLAAMVGDIFVPPFTTRTSTGEWTVSRTTHVYALSSHMHRHGIEFGATWRRAGADLSRVYFNRDWDDPVTEYFDEPLVLRSGDSLRFWATYHYHDAPSASSPPLTWGMTSEDEMGILLGFYAQP